MGLVLSTCQFSLSPAEPLQISNPLLFLPIMSYAHGFQGPSSLPADYAILSARFNDSSAQNVDPADSGVETESDDEEHDTLNGYTTTRKRRCSSPASSTILSRPLNPSMARREIVLGPRVSGANETTPLMNPDVPLIHEISDGEEEGKMVMFWQELRILTKYSLPVFGYVHFPSPPPSILMA